MIILVPPLLFIRIIRGLLLLFWCGSLLIALLSWLIPIEVAQAWAINNAPPDDFSRFEAFGAATAATWFIRCLGPTAAVLSSVAWTKREKVVPFLSRGLMEFWQMTAPPQSQMDGTTGNAKKSLWGRIRTNVPRLMVIAWLLLAVYQFGLSIQRRLWDWPVYGLRPGNAVLPNISDSNREVIRYLEEATPPRSRILVLSDQKLYFLSYYLLPRRLYHPMHPDSEFVIAQAHNQRQMAAYQFEDLDPERVRRLHPDYILDYFEGSSFLAGVDLSQDAKWIEFEKRRHGPDWKPSYRVSLRPY